MELVESVEEEFGVTALSLAPQPGISPQVIEDINEAEPTAFEVKLTEIGGKKIEVIKIIRALLALGLRESKDFVESAPILVKGDLTRAEAEEIKEKLEAAGATVVIS
jgi:large subunit ribosomal protein L7/L12